MKKIVQGILGHHLMRRRQHHRFMRSVTAPMIALGRTRGLLLMGGMALVGEYLRRRKARNAALPETVS